MRKLFLCAAAAIVALASCSKTEVINTEVPKEINFKAVTGVMTKAEQTTSNFTQNLGVIAYINGGIKYFDNTVFSKSGQSTNWEANKFWPLQNNLDFIVYSPYQSMPEFESKKLKLTVDNSQFTKIGDQYDYLYGEKYFNNTGSGYANQSEAVGVSLVHALAKVTLNFKGSSQITLQSVTLERPTLKGTYTIDYTSNQIAPVWETLNPEENDLLLEEWTPKALTSTDQKVSIMVVPNSDSDILLTYTIEGHDGILNASIPLNGTWSSGTHYVYNITMTTHDIKFSPSVEQWYTNTNTTIDKTI